MTMKIDARRYSVLLSLFYLIYRSLDCPGRSLSRPIRVVTGFRRNHPRHRIADAHIINSYIVSIVRSEKKRKRKKDKNSSLPVFILLFNAFWETKEFWRCNSTRVVSPAFSDIALKRFANCGKFSKQERATLFCSNCTWKQQKTRNSLWSTVQASHRCTLGINNTDHCLIDLIVCWMRRVKEIPHTGGLHWRYFPRNLWNSNKEET